MFYKWERNDGEELLESDECIIDYTFISEEHFILIVLLTSYGDLRVSYNVRGSGSKQKVIPIREFASSVQCADAKALCLVPDASCIALILSNGNVLLVSIKTLVDVPWGHEGIVGDDSLALIEIDTNGNGNGNSDCLKTPTSALSYCGLYSKRPILIYSNKAGQIFIIDLTTRKLSVGLGAPQSIHSIETFTTPTSVHLLVTGFTGAQWVVPLENEGRSLRETLGNVIPSELQQLHQSAARLSTTENGKLCFLDIVNHKVQVFDEISMKQCTYESNVPENTWLVHLTSNTLFAICDQTSMKTAVHFGLLSPFAEIVYDELEVKLPDERILAIIPITDWQSLSSCIVVTEKGLLRIVPAKTLDEALVEFVVRHHYEMHYCDYLTTRLQYERLKLCTMIVRNSLRLINNSNKATTTTGDRSSDIQAIIKLAFSAQIEIGTIIRIFNEYDVGDALLPTVLERCATNKNDECKYSIVELYISKLRKNYYDRDNIESDLSTFLLKHVDVSSGIELLLKNGLWSCVAIVVSRSASQHSESVANFLCSDGLDWPTDKVSHLVRTLNSISWNSLPPNAEQLLIRMINYLPHLRSLSHIVSFARIGEGQMNRFHQAGATLYALCTLRLLDATPSFDYTSLPSNTSLSCGSNCITLISEDESVIFIGEFSAGSMKMKDAERNKIVANRYALPRQINIPERVCSVSSGTEHVLCLTTYGTLYSFGKNRFGECGVGHKREVSEVSRVRGSFEGIRSICTGHYHSALIDSKGRVFTWGWAIHGQLGHETRDRFEDITEPRLVETIDEEIKAVCCGYAHTIFLSERGVVYGCGNSIYGQLGCGEDMKKRYRPSVINIPEKVKLISSKYFHGIAVSESQKIYQWGTNPLSLKMKAFLAKRVRTANREQQQQQQQEQSSINIPSAILNDKSPDINPLETSQSYLSVSRVEHAVSGEIMAIDAGYSHSALITKTGTIYTWGKGLEMQLGHGNKKEQQEPHQLFEPSAVIWQRVSCGLDFTSAVSSDGNVFVWGRNDKCQLGVQSLPAPHLTRKLIIKGPKGPRSIQIAADSPCVAIPTRLSSVTAFVPSETSSDDLNDGNLIRFLQRLDADTISNISSQLQRNAIVSAPAIFVHLLAGELQRAIELLVQMPIADQDIDKLLRDDSIHCDVGDADEPQSKIGNSGIGRERQPTSLLTAIWDLTLKHPNFIEQWNAISTLIRTYPIGDLVINDRKLSAEASMILATKPDMLNGLSAAQKLRLLEKWQPEAALHPIEIAQNDLQNMGSRIRYWSCCGNVEKFNASSSLSSSLNNEKRRICSKCSDAWRCAIKSKFSRYA